MILCPPKCPRCGGYLQAHHSLVLIPSKYLQVAVLACVDREGGSLRGPESSLCGLQRSWWIRGLGFQKGSLRNPRTCTRAAIGPSLYPLCLPCKSSLGGKVRLMITGAAPVSATVLTFLRAALGCQVRWASPRLLVSGFCQPRALLSTKAFLRAGVLFWFGRYSQVAWRQKCVCLVPWAGGNVSVATTDWGKYQPGN